MAILLGILRPLHWLLDRLLAACRALSIALLALMVAAILLQVVMRYVFGAALAWPEEAARFGMLWLVGLMAPVAYRRGGFVAIDMAERALPPRAGAALVLGLLIVSLAVILYMLPLAARHVASGCLFTSSSLWTPFDLALALPLPGPLDLTLCTKGAPAFGLTWGWTKVPLAAMYASLYVGLQLLVLVNVELVLRNLVALLGEGTRLPEIRVTDMASAE